MTNRSLQALKEKLVDSSPLPLINSSNITGYCFLQVLYLSWLFLNSINWIGLGRGKERSKPLHRSSEEERREVLNSRTSMKERLSGTPFMHLSLSHTLIKSTLDKVGKNSYESCLNMACSNAHVRLQNAKHFN